MPYTRATLADFQVAFPAFAAITEAQYDFWATRAERIVTDCFGDDQQFATMLLTAHYLERNGLGSGAAAEANAQGMGEFTRVKSGSLELERGTKAAGASMGEYCGTRYGRQLWPMHRACFGSPRVTSTGTIPCGGFAWPLR